MIKFLEVLRLVIILLVIAMEASWAQTPARLDSLQSLLKQSKPDTSQVGLVLQISEEYENNYYQIRGSNDLLFKKYLFLLDSALTYAKQGVTLSRQRHYPLLLIESLLAAGNILDKKAIFPEAIRYAGEALALSKVLPNPRKIAESLVLLGILTERSNRAEINTTIEYYEEAIAIYKQQGDRVQAAYVMHLLANFYMRFVSQTKAKQIQLDRVAVLKPLGPEHWIPALVELANVCSTLGNHQEALKYQLQCLRYYERTMNSERIDNVIQRLAWTYKRLHDYPRSIDYFNKSIRSDSLAGNIVSVLRNKGQIIEMYQEQHNQEQARRYAAQVIDLINRNGSPFSVTLAPILARSYKVVGEYEKAEYWFLKILPEYEKPPVNLEGLSALYSNIGELYIMKKEYNRARFYLKKAFVLNENAEVPARAIFIHLELFKVDSIQGKLSSALWHYQQATSIKDSLFNETKNKQLEELQVQYDTEKKEQDLILKEQNIKLLTQDKELQAKQLERDKLFRNVIIGGALLLLALLVTIYRRYRLKQRTNRQLEAHQLQLQTQHKALQGQQEIINHKNEELTHLVAEKNVLLTGQQQLLVEKERLLREIHHRVKNNLQVVMSLLNSQAASLEDKSALSAIKESQHRIGAMALIHQRLYQSEGIASIQMRPYLQEILSYLHDSYSLSSPVHFHVQVDEIELDVSKGVPLGLIINEALTNAFKYAFPDGRSGTISLSLFQLSPATYQLTIADDGVGLPDGFDPAQSRSLGMVLLHGFSGQLGGELALVNENGLSITLVFGDEPFTSTVEPSAQVSAKRHLFAT